MNTLFANAFAAAQPQQAPAILAPAGFVSTSFQGEWS
jgi:hypothetical protein